MRVACFLGIALLAATAGCGSESGSNDSTTSASTSGSGGSSAQLEISFWPEGRAQGQAQVTTLSCDPSGGTHASPAAACEQLDGLDDPFAPPPADEVCTELYGGPQEAEITGTYRGDAVSYKLARTNGCEVDRYERLSFLLPGGGRA